MKHRRSRRLGAAVPAADPAAPGAVPPPAGAAAPAAAAAAAVPLWLAVHLPLLPLESWRATLDAQARARPLALLAGQRVSHVDAAAAMRGIRPGMKRATALALAAELLPGTADAARDAAALQAVAHAALAFTPAVAIDDPATVVLEVRSCLRLFGGLDALLARLGATLAPLGHRLEVAAAPIAAGAALLARWVALSPPGGAESGAVPPALRTPARGAHVAQRRALAALLDAAPAWLPGSARARREAFDGMGLHTLAGLRALPRPGLARRFGEGLLDELDRAYGLRPDPRLWLEAPPFFDSRLELFACAEHAEQVLAGAAVLLARLVAWARARQGRIGAFTLAMRHEPRHGAPVAATELHVELAEPALDPAHLQLLLRERLGRMTLAAPTLELGLRCSGLVAGPPPDGDLFPTRHGTDHGLLRLLERLRARLGDEQVQRLVPVADHRPGRANRCEPALTGSQGAAARPARPAPAGPDLPLHRPAFVLSEPQPLAECDGLPALDGAPLQLLSGPERIESGWWDGGLVTRDYFIAATRAGALVWLWRERLPPGAAAAQWYLQGRFA
ncbi:MAG: Y-family DNA polymerase [Pseudomonadota bacterium]